MRTSKVSFEGHAGPVAGVLDLPEDEPKGVALFAHCFTCSKDLRVAREIARQLTEEGIGVLRFDFTGLGESEGEFHETSFATNLEDLRAAAGFLEREQTAPGMLIGHSLGGAAVLAVAPELGGVRCVATIGAPAEAAHVQHLLTGAAFVDEETAEVTIGGRPFRIGRELVEDLERRRGTEHIRDLTAALMVMPSPVDRVVGIDNAERIYVAAKHPKSFVSLDRADHLLSDPRDARFAGHVLSAWAGYYLGD
ncbi:MAG: alpha/beta hydrolase family protein [Phycisphaerales bacterium JB059]